MLPNHARFPRNEKKLEVNLGSLSLCDFILQVNYYCNTGQNLSYRGRVVDESPGQLETIKKY